MKKVVFFTQNLDVGGVQKSIYLLANYLKEYFNIHIILAEDNKNIEYQFNDILIDKIKTLKINTKEQNIGKNIFNYRVQELEALLEKIKPDILLSYEDYNNLIALSTSYDCKKIASCRVTIKDSYDNNNIHLLDSKFYYKNIEALYPKADKIITVSFSIEKELQKLFNLSNTTTIHNGIEKRITPNEKISFSNFILNIGRLHKQKGQLDLINAFDKIKENITEDLVIVGDGILKNELQNKIEELKLQNRVFLVGFDEPHKYINECSLFVFPSYYEGFSNTVLEVMSSKKNIVSYSYKGSEEILFNENLVDMGNVDLLANQILFYLKNKKENKDLEDKLYEKSKEFSLDTTLKKYKKEIERLCAE